MNTAPSYPLQRDARLDFFRGIALLIILINHIPFNELSLYTPSRFGLSDAAELFVFISGCAAAIAYQRSFMRFLVGTARVLHRCGQIYMAHLQIFIALALACVIGNTLFVEPDYIGRLNLYIISSMKPRRRCSRWSHSGMCRTTSTSSPCIWSFYYSYLS
ncbi:MAG TPA: OpgC domain-containing protein [Gammaproteobacteria bacterium]|nr:OpgC domain-containing protein [Gammaproteobacteria bacterium]